MTKRIYAADLFCGAGGTSTGLMQAAAAMGIDVELLAVNHWETAVETHAMNHPEANHLCASLDQIDPSQVIKRKRLDLLVASPECTHHSVARGGKPRDDQSRASAWHVLHWCERLRVENVILENVPEFRSWGPLGSRGKPLKSRKGETYRAFIAALESLGYRISWRILNCADYGDATTRKRLFIMATRRRRGPVWPEESHQAPGSESLFGERAQWRPAREIIDWDVPGRSIFGRKKPLAEKTIARIAEGLRRYGGKAAEPFLVMLYGTGTARDLKRPLPTVTAKGNHMALCQPFVLGQHGGGVARPVSHPIPTIATKGATRLVQPFIVPRYGERQGQAPRTHSVDDPMPTIPGTCQHNVVEPFVVTYYGTGGPRPVDEPLRAVTTKDRFGLVEPQGAHLDIHLRMLQPHELAAAMSFPDGYRFAGNRTETVKQIGNAVPVRTAEALCAAALRRGAA